MGYKVNFELKHHYLCATIYGERTTENISAIAKEVLDICKEFLNQK